jgi:hypothetical protein
MNSMICEERQDIDKVDASNRKVGKVSQGGTEAYLCTGEFGGTGGRGGGLGLASRGIVVFWLSVVESSDRLRLASSGHREEKGREGGGKARQKQEVGLGEGEGDSTVLYWEL